MFVDNKQRLATPKNTGVRNNRKRVLAFVLLIKTN